MATELGPYERLCPSYATAPLRTLGLSTDGMMLFMVVLVISRHLIDSSLSLFVAWGVALFVQKQAEKSGFRDGFLKLKASVWLSSPWMMKYAPVFARGIARVWQSSGSIAAPGYKNRFTR